MKETDRGLRSRLEGRENVILLKKEVKLWSKAAYRSCLSFFEGGDVISMSAPCEDELTTDPRSYLMGLISRHVWVPDDQSLSFAVQQQHARFKSIGPHSGGAVRLPLAEQFMSLNP